MKMILSIVVLALTAVSLSEAGTSFIRWGRTTCPTGNAVLYKGYMVSHHYSNGGNGANYLCTPETPQFVRPKPGFQGAAGIWGVEFEYRTEFGDLFLGTNVPEGKIHDQDMPCVLCYVAGSTDKIMVPGRQDCANSGYDFQYKGFLVAEVNSGRFRSEYICVDEAPEGRVGGSGDNNQGVFYPVEIGCGSLPCNPFVDGYEMTCAVCTY